MTPNTSVETRLPLWRQLRSNLVFYFLLLAIIPILVITLLNFLQTSDDAREQAFNQLESVVELKQDQLHQWLNDSSAVIALLSANEQPQELLVSSDDTAAQADANELLAQSVQNYPSFESLFIYDLQGQINASSTSDDIGQTIASQPYFAASLASNRIQPPYLDPNTNELFVVITNPITDSAGNVIGALAGRLDHNVLAQIMAERHGLGTTGETYLVSAENSFLLTPSRFEGYTLNRAYHSEGIDRVLQQQRGSDTYESYRDVTVLGVYRWIPELQVGLVGEIEEQAALQSAISSRNTSTLIAVIAVLAAALAGLYIATRVSKPLTQLTEIATRLASGDFKQRAAVDENSEVGVLGGTLNRMADQIQGIVAELETRAAQRTHDLEATLEIGRIATGIAASEELLPQIVETIRDRFNLYYTQIYLIDEARRNAVLHAGTGIVGQRLLRQNHRLDLSETSIVARTVQTGQPVLVEDTESSAVHLPNPLLPDTRSEVSFPLAVSGRILGVLDMQAVKPGTFNSENIFVFEAMANTLAGILQSNAAFDEAQAAIAKADAVNRRLTRQNWEGYLGKVAEGQKVGYQYDLEAPTPLDEWTTLPDEAAKEDSKAHAVLPITLGGQKIGNILVSEEWERQWTTEEMALVEDVAERVAQAVEQLRVFDETEARARELATVAEVSTRVASTLNPDEVLQSVADLTQERFNLYHAHIYLIDPNRRNNLVLAAGAGDIGRQMVAARHSIPMTRETSLVARAARTRQVVLSNNVTLEPTFLANPMLPHTKSEMALPMIVGDELLGVLDVQARTVNRFGEKDIQVQTTLAGQLAVALANARAFQEIERARQETERIYNSSIDMLGSANLQGFFINLNPAWEGTLGYSRQDLMAKPIIELVHPDDLEMTNEMLSQIAEGALSFENRCRCQDGSYKWISWNTAPDMVNKQIHFVARDITERKQSEEFLQQARAEAETLYLVGSLINEAQNEQEILDAIVKYAISDDISNTSISLYDNIENPLTALIVADWRRGGVPMLGVKVKISDFSFLQFTNRTEMFQTSNILEDSRFDLQSRNALAAFGVLALFYVPLVVGDKILGTLSVSSEQPHAFTENEMRILRSAAEQAAVTIERIRLLHQTEKRAVELQVVAEVSAVAARNLKKAELLQAFSDLTRDSFDLYHAHVYLLSESGDILALSAGAGTVGKQMVARNHQIRLDTTHSLVARAARTRLGVISNDVTQEPDFLPNPLLPDTRSEMALPIITGDKLVGVLDVQSDAFNRFTDEDVRIQNALAGQIAVALSNAELYEEQLSTAERLRDLDKLKSEFLASMSHELRTPLNSIIGYAEVMLDGLDGPLSEDMREDISAIHGSGKLLLTLINDILDLAKIEAGQMGLEYETVDTIAFLERIVETSQILVKPRPVQMRLLVHEENKIPPALQADPVRLQQIINNLLSNAAKFTEEGSITVHVTPESDYLRIAVEDTGIGIRADMLEAIFERFRQVDQSSTRRKGGTGLGLDITRRLVQMHGGTIWVESEYGVGTTFTFTLPIMRPVAIPADGTGVATPSAN